MSVTACAYMIIFNCVPGDSEVLQIARSRAERKDCAVLVALAGVLVNELDPRSPIGCKSIG